MDASEVMVIFGLCLAVAFLVLQTVSLWRRNLRW